MYGQQQQSAQAAAGGADMMDETGAGDRRMGQLAANDLIYTLPNDLSVTVNKTHKNQYFQNSSYLDTQRGYCILNSGADYGDMRNSTLELGIRVNVANDNGVSRDTIALLGEQGSILNIIKSITIMSRSGDVLSQINDLNLLRYQCAGYSYSKQWQQSVGQMIGYGSYLVTNTSTDETKTNTTGLIQKQHFREQRFSIPLYLLSDFFAYGRLMPSMLLSGLRIEIEWESPNTAFQLCSAEYTSNAAYGLASPGIAIVSQISNYEIVNPYISLLSVQLTDGVQREINQLSATNGLELVYCDYERTDRDINTNATITFTEEVRKAASRALRAVALLRPLEGTRNTVTSACFNSFATEPFAYLRWQWQLGSLYYPQQPVATTAQDGPGDASPEGIIAETYKHTLIGHNTLKANNLRESAIGCYTNFDRPVFERESGRHGFADVNTVDETTDSVRKWLQKAQTSPYSNRNSVRISKGSKTVIDEKGESPEIRTLQAYDYGTFANGNSVVTCQLERSDLFNLSGVPINNSRVLQFRADLDIALCKEYQYKPPSALTDTANVAANLLRPGGKYDGRRLTIFLKYVRLARVFLTNVEVEQ